MEIDIERLSVGRRRHDMARWIMYWRRSYTAFAERWLSIMSRVLRPMHPNDQRNPLGYNFLMAHTDHQGDDCLIWPYTVCTPGYGIFNYQRKGYLAHRFMCEQKNGPPPSSEHLAAHSCGNRRCVNPNHLDWKTHAGNQLDRRAHGTNCEKRSKLTPIQATQIRQLKGVEKSIETAARYGVTESNVRMIQEGLTWRVDRKQHHWTKEEDSELRSLVAGGASFAETAKVMGKSIGPLRSHAFRMGIKSSFDPHAPRGPKPPRPST